MPDVGGFLVGVQLTLKEQQELEKRRKQLTKDIGERYTKADQKIPLSAGDLAEHLKSASAELTNTSGDATWIQGNIGGLSGVINSYKEELGDEKYNALRGLITELQDHVSKNVLSRIGSIQKYMDKAIESSQKINESVEDIKHAKELEGELKDVEERLGTPKKSGPDAGSPSPPPKKKK